MNNFQILHRGLDVVPLANELIRNEHLWNQNDLRTTHEASPHTQVDDIFLRFNDLDLYKDNPAEIIDEHESINYPALSVLTQARQIIFWLMSRVQGERLGRCLITRLAPGDVIEAHEDGGSHADYYDRYHVVLQGLPGSVFNCGDESVVMLTGEVWWFRNNVTHEVINNSADDRIHMIIDIRTSK